MTDLGKLLKDYPEYGKKTGDIISVFRPIGGGNVVEWKAWSRGIAMSEDTIKLKVGTDVKLISDANSIKAKPSVEPITRNAKVILLRNVGGLKKGESIDVYVPLKSNPSVITYYNPKEKGKRYRLIVNRDIQPPVFTDEPTPEIKTTEEPSKPNWVLIGGIVLVGYLIFKK